MISVALTAAAQPSTRPVMVLLSGCLPAFGRAVRSGPFFRRGSRLRRLRWPYLPQAISRCSCSGRWHSYLRADGMEIGVDRAELYGSDFYGRLVCCRRTEPIGARNRRRVRCCYISGRLRDEPAMDCALRIRVGTRNDSLCPRHGGANIGEMNADLEPFCCRLTLT